MMLALLEAFPAGEPVVVLLDNLDAVMDGERGNPHRARRCTRRCARCCRARRTRSR